MLVMPKNSFNFEVDNVRVSKMLGGCLSQSEVIKGMVFTKDVEGSVEDVKDAKRMLNELSGHTHRVLTAVAVAVQSGRKCFEALSTSRVTFEAMTHQQINAYAATGEPMGKAGAYAVQGRAALHITRIDGSYTGVMGLPIAETEVMLRRAGIHILNDSAT